MLTRRRKLVKIYGERNTGTNYLKRLVETNFNVRVDAGVVPRVLDKLVLGNEVVKDIYMSLGRAGGISWKHAFIDSNSLAQYKNRSNGKYYVITLTKNPYSWLHSLYRNSYHIPVVNGISFAEFLRSEYKCVRRDNLGESLPSVVDLWNVKNRSYVAGELAYRGLNLRTEDIYSDFDNMVEYIGEYIGESCMSGSVVNYERSTKDKKKGYSYYKEYYTKEKWLDEYDNLTLSYVNSRLDMRLMRTFGYEVMDGTSD